MVTIYRMISCSVHMIMEMGIGQNDQQRWEITQHDQEIHGLLLCPNDLA